MKSKKLFLILLAVFACFNFVSIANAYSSVNILINGNKVNFTSDTGYPFVDKNNRTMVPLRVTMETAGFAVGYDSSNETAIIITDHDRIEIPVGTNYIYNNNNLIKNDTNAVIKDNRIYLPIRAVLESADFTVAWDSTTNTVNAYIINPNSDELVLYSTSDLSELVKNVLEGNVVYINGQYYVTPEYLKLLTNVKVYYSGDDLNKAIYPQESRFFDFSAFEESYKQQTLSSDWIDIYTVKNLSDIPNLNFDITLHNGKFVYGFYKSDIYSEEEILICDEIPNEFIKAQNSIGYFNGIHMKKENGKWFFNPKDLVALKII